MSVVDGSSGEGVSKTDEPIEILGSTMADKRIRVCELGIDTNPGGRQNG